MSHEITDTDKVAIVGSKGWHGLAENVDGLMTPEQLRRKVLDWEPVERPLFTSLEVDGETIYTPVEESKMIVRSDNDAQLGVVGSDYSIFGNDALTRLVETIVGAADVPCIDTGGSLKGGRRVWMLIKLGEIDVLGVDPVHLYGLVASGHDGLFKLRILPTSTRVVCHNTFTAAGAYNDIGMVVKHSKHMNVCHDRAREVLAGPRKALAEMGEKFDALAGQDADSAWMSKFFTRVYAQANGAPTPFIDGQSEAQRKKAERTQRKAEKVMSEWVANYEDADGGDAHANIRRTKWAAFNAVTRWADHSRTVRGETEDPTRRIESNYFGTSQDFKAQAFQTALSI